MDRISNLPLNIIETILCFLPIQDAARTSILSKEWRYNWIKIPKLEFIERKFQAANNGVELSVLDQPFDHPSEMRRMYKRCKFFYAIYQVLLMHRDPIDEFTLKMTVDDSSCAEIDHIILHLSTRNTIKILKLDFGWGYTLPSSLFKLHQLTELNLVGCVLDDQRLSYVFSSLTALTLQELWTSEKALLRLLSSCPSLKRLNLLSDSGTIEHKGEDFTIIDLFECLLDIEYLFVTFFIFICFTPNRLPQFLPAKLVHLKYLRMLCVWFSHKYAVPFFFLLIRSSPNLEKLKLELSVEDVFEESETAPCKLEDYSDVMFERLNDLEILDFSDRDNELAVVKLILAKSPVLKNVRIHIWDELDKDDKLKISKMLLSLPCASSVVKITLS